MKHLIPLVILLFCLPAFAQRRGSSTVEPVSKVLDCQSPLPNLCPADGAVCVNTSDELKRCDIDGNTHTWSTISGGGGGTSNSFETWNAPAGTDPVADSAADTINFTGGSGITITGDAGTDTIDIAAHEAVTLGGSLDYLTIAGQIITRAAIDLATDVTGELPDGNISDTITVGAAGTVNIGALPVGNAGEQYTANEAETAMELQLASKYVSARANTGTINPGDIVYQSGWSPAGFAEVALADASTAATMPAIGIAIDTITTGQSGRVQLFGANVGDYDTSGFSDADPLWVSESAGDLTNTKPTGSALVQKFGIVGRAHASQGQVTIVGAGRTNDVPNDIDVSTSLTLLGSTTPTPTTEGDIEWDTDDHVLAVGDSASTALFYPDNTEIYFCGDEDNDGDYQDDDIDDCINAVSTLGGGIVQLECTTWTLDPDGDGVGESRCNTYTNTKNPHICMQADVWLRGCGPGVTVLDLGTQTTTPDCPAGQAFYIGSDHESNTDTAPTARLDNWRVTDLTIQGEGGCGDGGAGTCNSSSVGVGMWHGDDIVVRNVEFRNLDQAGCHMNSCNSCVCEGVSTYRVGGWDTDGPGTVGTCTPDNQQPGSYMYVSGGRASEGNVMRDIESLETGSRGFSLRTGTNIQRDGPLGTVAVEFTASTSESIAQTFLADNVSNINTGIVLACAQIRHIDTTTDTDGTGDIDFSIQTTSAGAPTGTAVTNHDTSDYVQVDGALIGQSAAWTCWLNTTIRDANGDTNITNNTTYAAVWTYTTASTNSNVMAIMGDETSTDTYTGGATYNYNGSSWSAAGTGFDLNFTLQDGVHIEPLFENIAIDTMSGVDGTGGTCFNVEGGLSPVFRKISCKDTGGSIIGAFPNFGTNVDTVLYDGAVNGPGAMLTIQTQTNSAAPFRGVKIEDPGAGVNCVTIEKSAAGITFDGATLIRCGDSAFKVQGFGERISIVNSNIIDPDGNGILFDTLPDDDGETGGFTSLRVQNTLIDGPQLYPVEFDNTTGEVDGVVITGNIFRNSGAGIMRLRGVNEGVLITNNLFEGWARRSTAATDRRGIYVNPTSVSGVIAQNFYNATSGNEISIFDMRPTNADGLVVRDNIGMDTGGGIASDPVSYTAPSTLASRYEFTNNYVIGHTDNQNDDGQARISGKETITDGDSCGTEGFQRGDMYIDPTGSDGTALEFCLCDGTNWQCQTFS